MVKRLATSPHDPLGNLSNTEQMQQIKAYTAASIITHAQSKAVKQAHIRTSNIMRYNYYNEVPSNTDPRTCYATTHKILGTVAQKLKLGATNSISDPSSTTEGSSTRLQKEDVFGNLSKLNASFQKRYQTNRLSKRSPALPISLQSELSTADNRRKRATMNSGSDIATGFTIGKYSKCRS
ncbi:Soluble starch synthase 3 isoform 2 [Dorcoceras hygrometricum]|uniref:Soluble starch synthase 3 isoform 2 n=1 Tax=Dorcoceras hygrometricum TaxID=472368 RepID=A0A2Z7B644_9LAMI|nr:Soluble starch synthase 3 isoform 2 [Dorcoceras hygrometricum]